MLFNSIAATTPAPSPLSPPQRRSFRNSYVWNSKRNFSNRGKVEIRAREKSSNRGLPFCHKHRAGRSPCNQGLVSPEQVSRNLLRCPVSKVMNVRTGRETETGRYQPCFRIDFHFKSDMQLHHAYRILGVSARVSLYTDVYICIDRI